MNAVNKVMKKYGTTFSEDVGFKISNKSSQLFKLLLLAMLASAKISYKISTEACKNLLNRKWTTAEKMKNSSWDERVKALDAAGYARYDLKTATMLEDLSNQVIELYQGDLRNLRKQAERNPTKEKELLKELKGIGNTGASIFLREIQNEWDECYPYADEKALQGAKRLRLTTDLKKIKKAVKKEDFPKFVASLVKIELNNGELETLT